MLIARILIIVALSLVTFASAETNYSPLSRVLESNGDRSSSVKKRREEVEYFEQCRFVTTWKERLGHVSVLAFLDPSWQYSYRQAVMLNILGSRLRRSGFPDIRFFVISPPPNLTQDKTEIEDEIEAWRRIATSFPDIEDFVNSNVHVLREDESEIIFLQDGPQFRMWKKFRASRDQVIVIDRCGRLTYQVIVPWSILYFPYVKAAILSTYQEDPCGECNPSVHKAPVYKEYLETRETDSRGKADDADVDPMRITERLENVTLPLNEALEEEHGTSVTPPIPLDEATDNTDRLDLASVTELSVKSGTAYQSDNDTARGSSIGESRMAERNQGDLTNSSQPSETIEAFQSQQDVPAQSVMSTLKENNSANHGETGDRVSTPHEAVTDANVTLTDGTDATIKTTAISETVDDDGVSGGDGSANISSDNFTEYGQNDSVDRSDVGDTANIEGAKSPPLRVIMYAPHVHRNGIETKKYTHLILEADNPGYHGHLDSEINDAPPTDLLRERDLQIATSKEHETDIKLINEHREDINKKYIFDPDESPGLYGEIADYWRSQEDSDITDRNETSNDNNYNNSTISYNEQHRSNASSDQTNSSKSSKTDKSYSNANTTIDPSTEDSVEPPNGPSEMNSSEAINGNKQVNGEDEARNKHIIEHYSKLLAWIDYRLTK